MDTRILGRTGRTVSAIGLGTWQLGADWGSVDDASARAVLDASYAAGVTMYDTADVYGDGRSEQRIAAWLDDAGLRGEVFVATKMGRRMDQTVENYSPAHFREWADRSRANLGVDTLDLVQLHCPPDGVYASDAVFDSLDALVADGTIAAYGVSVETVDQALAAIARPGVATVQIILNAFRLKPLDAVLPAAQDAGVGIIARVPLASGLLSGRYDHDTAFAADDHRTYNRDGSAFDVGETFSGVDFDEGVEAARGSRPSPAPTTCSPRRRPSPGSRSCPASARSSRGRAASPRRRAMRPRDRCPRSGRSSPPRFATSTTAASAPPSTRAGSGVHRKGPRREVGAFPVRRGQRRERCTQWKRMPVSTKPTPSTTRMNRRSVPIADSGASR